MAKTKFEEFDRFESAVTPLDQAKIDVPLGKFTETLGFEATERIIKSLTPATFTPLPQIGRAHV